MSFRAVSNLKVKEVPDYVKSVATRSNLASQAQKWVTEYEKKYIRTSSSKPLFDVLIYGGIMSYAVGWRHELEHMKHEEEKKKHEAAHGAAGEGH